MTRCTWIENAVAFGAVLSMASFQRGRIFYHASLARTGCRTVWGEPHESLETALESLDRALQEDAAGEMVAAGAA